MNEKYKSKIKSNYVFYKINTKNDRNETVFLNFENLFIELN